MFSIVDSECYVFGTEKLTQEKSRLGCLIALALKNITTVPEKLNYARFCDLLRESRIDISYDLYQYFPFFQTLHQNLRHQLQNQISNYNDLYKDFYKNANKFSLEHLKQVIVKLCNVDFASNSLVFNAAYNFLSDAPNPLLELKLSLSFNIDGNCKFVVMYFGKETGLSNFSVHYSDTENAMDILYDAVPIRTSDELETLLQCLSFDRNSLLLKILQKQINPFIQDLCQGTPWWQDKIDEIFNSLQSHLICKFEALLPRSSSYNNLK